MDLSHSPYSRTWFLHDEYRTSGNWWDNWQNHWFGTWCRMWQWGRFSFWCLQLATRFMIAPSSEINSKTYLSNVQEWDSTKHFCMIARKHKHVQLRKILCLYQELDIIWSTRKRPSWVVPVSGDYWYPIKAQGYLVLRFRANNPGAWPLHCHNLMHNLEGMAVFINITDEENNRPYSTVPGRDARTKIKEGAWKQ